MTDAAAGRFGGLLRRLRSEAGLTQEDLAHAAGLSPRSISDLERGVHTTSRKDTARLLADALNLTGAARGAFEAAARGRGADLDGPADPGSVLARSIAATTPKLPRDIREFTGRDADLARMMAAVTDRGGVVEVCAIDGMAGVGKSAFAVHAAHMLKDRFPEGQIYLSLNAHTAGHRPLDPADALAGLLVATGVHRHQIPDGLEDRSALWRAHVAGKRMLLLLDDAAGHEQVRPLLPGTPGSLVLITSRRNLTALDGATSICLETFPPEQAALLLIRLADRPDLDPADPAVGRINEMCGYLPLAIGMLARQLRHHPAWTADGLASYLAAARNRLELMHAENLSVAAAFDMSYQDLTADQQRVFRRLGLHPGTDIDSHAAAALNQTAPAAARLCLDDLFDHHLVTEHATGRYRMHDLIHEHARELVATDDPDDCDAAVARLMAYYVRATSVFGRWFNRRPVAEATSDVELPPLTTLDDVVQWMEAERGNVHAMVDLAASRGWSDPAVALVTAMSGFLRTYGHWTNMRTTHMTALETARRVGNSRGEISILTNLGAVQRLVGDYAASAATLNRALRLSAEQGDRAGEARALAALSVVQRITVDFKSAIASADKALAISRDIGDQYGQADALKELGRVQHLAGDYTAARSSHEMALHLYRSLDDPFGQASSLRNIARTHADATDLPLVMSLLGESLELCRGLNDRLGQAYSLSYLGTFQHELASDDFAANSCLSEALRLYDQLGHRLGLAEVLIRLGDLYAGLDSRRARQYYERARQIARAIGAVYEEARAIEGLGTIDLAENHPGSGSVRLLRARETFLRMGSPRAQDIDDLLAGL